MMRVLANSVSAQRCPQPSAQQPRAAAQAVPAGQHARLRCRPAKLQSSARRMVHATASLNVSAATVMGAPVLPFRVGHGFDLHRLAPGLKLVIGGIDIPHDKGCEAHSDGDVLIHCIVDSILGALGLPDIGQLFPDNDVTWKGASSDRFLIEAIKRMREAGYEIGNIDATLIAQKPKLSPHKAAIKTSLCKMMGVHESVVNIKAKTHEKVDAVGEERAIACHSVVLLIRV